MGVEPLSTSRRSARANKSALMESGLKPNLVRDTIERAPTAFESRSVQQVSAVGARMRAFF